MTDKLFVQKWLDMATQEITKNGTEPYDSTCDSFFGLKYLETWQAARKEVCKPGGLSTYECYQHPPHNRQGAQNIGSLFCTATNLVLDSAAFLGDVLRDPEAKGGKARYPNPAKGSAKVACTLENPLPWTQQQVADQHTDRWLYNALAEAPEADVNGACQDPKRSVTRPVYFVTRMDPTNAYHHFEEVVNFFAALWMYPRKDLLEQGITVVAFDGAVPGFYLELWRRMAFPAKVRFLRNNPYPPGTCFRHALIASMPHRSMYTHYWPGVTTNCRGVVMTAVMRWAHELLADTRPESYTWPDGQHRQNGDTVVGRVLWVSRRHFEAANKHKFTGWQHQRILPNEDEVIAALTNAVKTWNAKSCLRIPQDPSCRKLPVYFELDTMELGDNRWYPEQLQTLARTNILMAVHGAGVFNELWMRYPASSTIEILHNSNANWHYQNLASLVGLPYHHIDSAMDVNAIGAKLTEVMDETAQRMVDDHKKRQQEAAQGTDGAAASVGGDDSGGR